MFKKILTITILVAVVGLLVYGAVNRTMAKSETAEGSANGSGNGRNAILAPDSSRLLPGLEQQGGGGNGGGGRGGSGARAEDDSHSQLAFTTGELSDVEKSSLIFMREEEKLARDVYAVLYEQWGLPVFQNISSSEQTHMDAVKNLLDGYGLTDPMLAEAGKFTNPELQSLYTDLVARGSQSVSEALKVGAAIEEIDILDLQESLAQTVNVDVQRVFNSLLNGSYNHLRAFTSTLQTQTGEIYQPQYMDMEAYQAALGSAAGNGGRESQGGWRGGRH